MESIEKLHAMLYRRVRKEKASEIETLFLEDFLEISNSIDLVIDSFSWRNGCFSRKLAAFLLDKEGKFLEERLKEARDFSKKSCFSLHHLRIDDTAFRLHISRILEAFINDSTLIKTFHTIRAPYANPLATRMIRHALFLEDQVTITDEKARLAVLSALFCKLRQNVGSCFATAFAIRIQEEDPMQFLQDFIALFQQGVLKRVVEGKEFLVPMNSSFGLGELKKPFIFFTSDLSYLANAYPIVFSLNKAGVEQNKILESLLKSNISQILKQEVLTIEKILELILRAYYQIDEKEIEQARKKTSLQLLYVPLKKELVFFEKSLQIAKSAFINLTDHALLKSWEFTLASFSEAQSEMAEWNLTISLGLNPNSSSGIGKLLQSKIEERIQVMNRELETLQHQINHIVIQLDSLQKRYSFLYKQ